MANKLQKSVAILSTGIAGLVAGKAITNVTDSYRRLEARIALTNKSVEAQAHAFKEINKIALETRSSQESLADLYSRIGRATKILGVEQKTVIQVTRSIAQAITISGSSAESANSAIVQLGQGLAAGALRGQELNSVMEQTPAVAQAIARGMGITIGQLRAFANEGKLSAQAVVDALSGQTKAIDEEFARIPVTFAQAFLVLTTGMGRIVNEVDQVFGFTEGLSASLLKMGKSMNAQAEPIANFLRAFQGTSLVGKEIGDVFRALGTLGGSILNALSAAFDRLIPLDLLIRIQQLKNFLLVELLRGTGEIIRFFINLDTMIIRLASGIDVMTASYERSFLSKGFRSASVGLISFIGDMQAAIAIFEVSVIVFAAQISQAIEKFAIGVNRIVGIVINSIGRIRAEFSNFEGYFDFSLVVRRSISETKKLSFIVGTVADVLGRVTDSFRKAYIAIIGNSWWTDTVDEVVAKAREFRQALKPINDFLDATVDKFKESWSMLGKIVRNDSMIFDYRELWLLRLRIELYMFNIETQRILKEMSKAIPTFFNKMGKGVEDGLKPAGGAIAGVGKSFNRMISDLDIGVFVVNNLLRGLTIFALALVSPFAAVAFGAINAIGFIVKATEGGLAGVSKGIDSMIDKMRQFTGEFDLVKDGLPALQDLGSKFNFLDGFVVGLSAIAELFRPIGRILTDTFGSAISAAAFGSIVAFTLPFKSVAILAGLLMRQELTSAINAVLALFGTDLSNALESLGDVGGRLAASIAKAIPQIVGLLGDVTTGFVNGFLDSFGIIGDLVRGLFNLINTLTLGLLGSLGGAAGAGILFALMIGKGPGKIFKAVSAIMGNIRTLIIAGTLTNAKGAISTMLFGLEGGAGLFGKVRSVMAPVFGYILTGIAAMTSALLKAIPALSGVFSFFSLANLKSIASGFTLINIQTAIANFSFKALAVSMLATASSIIATTTAIIAQGIAFVANIARSAVQIAANLGLSLSFGTLAGVLGVVANAARMMWVAMSGPFAPFMIGLLALIAMFSSTGAAASTAGEEVDGVAKKGINTRNKLANLFGMGVDLNINVVSEPKTVKETFDAIETANEETLYRMRKELADSVWFMAWIDDISTSMSLKWTAASTYFSNNLKRNINGVLQFFNDTFGSGFALFDIEDRSAVQQLLDEIDPTLFLDLDVNADDLKEFTNAETRGLMDSTLQNIQKIRAEIGDAKRFFGFFEDQGAIDTLNRQLVVQENRLETVTNALIRQVNAGKKIKEMTTAYEFLNERLSEASDLFGSQAISMKSQAEYTRLNAVEQLAYNKLIGEAEVINGRIQEIAANFALNPNGRKDQIAAELALLDEVGHKMGEVGTKLEAFSTFDLATQLGLDAGLIGKLTDTVMDNITKKQEEIIKKEREIAELRRIGTDQPSLAQAQLALVNLEREGDALVEGAERSLLSMFDRVTSDLANSDISISLSEYMDLGPELRERVDKYAAELRKVNLKVTEALGDPATLSDLEKNKAELQKTVGDALNVDIDTSQLDNFSKTLKAFSDIGINFDLETVSRIGEEYGIEAVRQAEKLSAELARIQAEDYGVDKAGREQRLRETLAYNTRLTEFELRLAQDREDILLNSKTAETLGQGFGDSIVGAMTGKSSFGETMAAMITGKLEQGLSDRIASFAEGFLDAFFDAFSGKGGIMGGIADALKGPNNREKESLKGAGSKLLGKEGEGSGMLSGLKAMFQDGGMFSGLTDAFKGITGSFGSIFDGLLGGMGGIFDGLLGGLSGAFEGLMGMFGGGGGGGGMGGLLSAGLGLFGFADGGAVRGPGTGTSDSIMAKLSNGEFVINAASTKKFRPMLEAINQGSMPAFADGGGVDLRGSSNTIMQEVAGRPSNNGQQTVQHINITGDISRQTKKEIFGMLPSIASGVNQHNREQNR